MAATTPKPLPSLDDLNRLLHLDVETGFLFWKARDTASGGCKMFNKRYVGERADRIRGVSVKYRTVKIKIGTKLHMCFAHRIVWKMVNGRDPVLIVDHIDRNPANNHPDNLREVDYLGSTLNRSLASKIGTGVYATKNGKFRSQVKKNGRITHLGTFETSSEAAAAYQMARRA